MCELKPLTPATGQPAEKDQYFPRPKISKKILRRLGYGENILLSAPRRIGKSSLLKALQAHPADGQIIKYLAIQSINNSEDFFQRLYKELICDHDIYNGAKSYFKQTAYAVKRYLNRVRGVSMDGEMQLDSHDPIDYYSECRELIRHFNDKKIILFIDEFPDAVNNMAKKDPDEAIHFLQQHRDLRQQYSNNRLQFVYTGSTGLRNVVTKLGKLNLINDLNELFLPTFSKQESHCLIQRLQLHYQIEFPDFLLTDAQINTILEKITWYLPYYLQAIVESLFDRYEAHETAISDADIDAVLLAMTKVKSSCASYFDNLIPRLEKNLDNVEFKLAVAILDHCAVHKVLEKETLKQLASAHPQANCQSILRTLEFDGYLNEAHQFNSNLLQQWWLENRMNNL